MITGCGMLPDTTCSLPSFFCCLKVSETAFDKDTSHQETAAMSSAQKLRTLRKQQAIEELNIRAQPPTVGDRYKSGVCLKQRWIENTPFKILKPGFKFLVEPSEKSQAWPLVVNFQQRDTPKRALLFHMLENNAYMWHIHVAS